MTFRFILRNVPSVCGVENGLERAEVGGGEPSQELRLRSSETLGAEPGQRQGGRSSGKRCEGCLGNRIKRCDRPNISNEWQGFVQGDSQKSRSFQNKYGKGQKEAIQKKKIHMGA